MKNSFLFGATVIMALAFTSCNDEEENSTKVSNLVLTQSVNQNVATLSASATNANTFSWNFGNGDTGNGASVQATYKISGKYWVKCTAAGKVDNLTDSIEVDIKVGDPAIYNEVTYLLCGYDENTGTSSAVWKWAGNGTLPNDFGMWSSGPKGHVYTNDSSENDWANDFDDSWWKLGEYDGVVSEAALDDRYTFKLNQELSYTNEYDTTGFMFNWAWIHKYGYGTPDVWNDEAVMQGTKNAAWDIEIIEHDADTLPKTIVSGVEVAKSYLISLKQGAWLGVGAASPVYQICRIDADTMWVRYDNTYPQDLPIEDAWAEEGISLDDPEWGYFYLVKAND